MDIQPIVIPRALNTVLFVKAAGISQICTRCPLVSVHDPLGYSETKTAFSLQTCHIQY